MNALTHPQLRSEHDRAKPVKLPILVLIGLSVLSTRCDRHSHSQAPNGPGDAASTHPVSDHIDVPEAVRRNLGITFARAERRSVAHTIRVPGRFELEPMARREYRTMLAGRVEMLVKQYEAVTPGTPLYRLASPEWRELQQKLNESNAAIRQTEARVGSIPSLLAAHRHHELILREGVALWESRLSQVEKSASAGAVSVDELTNVKNSLATKRAELAEVLEKEAELEALSATARAEHDAAHSRFRLLLSTASTLLGIDERELASPFELDEHFHTGPNIEPHPQPATTQPVSRWREIEEIEVKATMTGIVTTTDLTNGAWASAGSLVLSVIDPQRLRFRASAMQSDLGRLTDGLPAQIVPPAGGTMSGGEPMAVTLSIAPMADTHERTIDLIAIPSTQSAWARAGVSAHLEIVTHGGQPELAIPLAAVVQDGMTKIFFRRDAAHPDEVERIDADLGIDDGRWVVVKSELREGDEVVVDGAFQLLNATSGTAEKGGHFHADGTFHAEKDK